MKKVLARGRVLGNSNSEFARMLEGDGEIKTFTLKSGKQAKFIKTVVLSGDIESKTFVDASVNGRDQTMLSRESVSDITRTIKLQQFFPARIVYADYYDSNYGFPQYVPHSPYARLIHLNG